MKKMWKILVVCAVPFVFVGCNSTKTTIYDPGRDTHNLRDEYSVSSEEMRIVMREAVNSAMTNVRFKEFLEQFHQENGAKTRPVVALDKTKNDTNDPDLNTEEMTDMLEEFLLNAGVVDVTRAQGVSQINEIAASRELEGDSYFDQSTVAKRGTLKAARLVLRPKVISNYVKDGRARATTRTFVMEMADVKTGTLMWKFTKQLGFTKEKKLISW